MNNIKTYIIMWLAKVILKTMNKNTKKMFRRLEKTVSKLIKNKCHLAFNLINNTLSQYNFYYKMCSKDYINYYGIQPT